MYIVAIKKLKGLTTIIQLANFIVNRGSLQERPNLFTNPL